MAWIDKADVESAQGVLGKIYRDAIRRSGKVWQIVQLQSQSPGQLRAGLGLYRAVMHTDSSIPPRLRETLAVVVSKVNHCVY